MKNVRIYICSKTRSGLAEKFVIFLNKNPVFLMKNCTFWVNFRQTHSTSVHSWNGCSWGHRRRRFRPSGSSGIFPIFQYLHLFYHYNYLFFISCAFFYSAIPNYVNYLGLWSLFSLPNSSNPWNKININFEVETTNFLYFFSVNLRKPVIMLPYFRSCPSLIQNCASNGCTTVKRWNSALDSGRSANSASAYSIFSGSVGGEKRMV